MNIRNILPRLYRSAPAEIQKKEPNIIAADLSWNLKTTEGVITFLTTFNINHSSQIIPENLQDLAYNFMKVLSRCRELKKKSISPSEPAFERLNTKAAKLFEQIKTGYISWLETNQTSLKEDKYISQLFTVYEWMLTHAYDKAQADVIKTQYNS